MPVAAVLGSTMSYREAGSGGVPVVLLHGNPTSSYLWRNVMPGLAASGRCLAPDLIGMGESGKPDIAYDFADHATYLDAWFDAMGLRQVILVGHDWGGALAFDWARRNPERVRGVAFLETILKPMTAAEFPAAGLAMFELFRTPGVGEDLVLEQNVFLERNLPQGGLAPMSKADLDVYQAPYPTPQTRRPLLQWPRSMPLGGRPADVVARINAFDDWLAASVEVPKLLLTFDGRPNLMIGLGMIEWARASIARLEVEYCGPAGHHAPEDQPTAIAAALSGWCTRHQLRDNPSHAV